MRIKDACLKGFAFYNAVRFVKFIDSMLMQRFFFNFFFLVSEHPRCVAWVMRDIVEQRGRGKTQAGRRDKAIDLHCQSGEAINKSVTMKGERGRVWRSESRVYKRNTTKPGATGASSCWPLMGVRSGWFSTLCLMAHSSCDGPWHPWRSATHSLNPVCTLKGDIMV